jgi:hypothetical protein
MRDYTFYNAGCDQARGLGRIVLLIRRLFRRILRPIFFRQAELYEELDKEIATAGGRLDRTERILVNHQVDREALARRIAALEDRLEVLHCMLEDKGERAAMRKAS